MAGKRKSPAKKLYAKTLDYQRTFGSDQGRRVLNDLIDRHHMLHPVFIKDKDEAIFRDGQRSVILQILTTLKVDPHELLRRIEEIERDARSDSTAD